MISYPPASLSWACYGGTAGEDLARVCFVYVFLFGKNKTYTLAPDERHGGCVCVCVCFFPSFCARLHAETLTRRKTGDMHGSIANKHQNRCVSVGELERAMGVEPTTLTLAR